MAGSLRPILVWVIESEIVYVSFVQYFVMYIQHTHF